MKTLLFLIFTISLSANAFADGFKFKVVSDGGTSNILNTEVSFGSQTVSCLVDTGARYTQVKLPLLVDLPAFRQEQGGGISGVVATSDLVRSDVTAGSWQLRNLTVGRTAQLPFDCLLGNNIYMAKDFQINFETGEFDDHVLDVGQLFPLHRYVANYGGEFGFDLVVNGKSYPSIVDTGSTNSVLDSKIVEADPDNFIFIQEIQGTDGSNQPVDIKVYTAKTISFGAITRTNATVFAMDLSYLTTKIPGVLAVMGLNDMMDYDWVFLNSSSQWSAKPIKK